jgi:glycosyltransferase involved in cell wall biosynthesis
MTKILSLATAALKPGQLDGSARDEKGNPLYPRVDYVELQRKFAVEVMDYGAYRKKRLGNLFADVETRLRSDPYLAWLGYQRRLSYGLVFAWSERAGIPYAAFRRWGGKKNKAFVSMFTCWSDRQESVITRFNLFEAMDAIAVHCESMRRHFIGLGVPEHKVQRIPYSVDNHFFTPLSGVEQQPGLVLSLGEIRSRDYASLFQAVDGLDMNLLVAASGSWYAREKDSSLDVPVPGNTTLSGNFSLAELKYLYTRSQFVVLPLYDQVFSAGATASLEAMSMARPVVAFRSRGIVDYIRDGETGILVEPGNADALRSAILYLLENPEEARRMGQRGRQRVEEELNLDNYVNRVASWLQNCV